MSEKTEKLGVGLTEEEKHKIRVEAAKRDMSMSELARQIIMDAIEDDRTDGTDPNQTPEAAGAD
jgi:plasmid stability protein